MAKKEPKEKVLLYSGKVETSAQAEAIIKKAANIFLVIGFLSFFSTSLSTIQKGVDPSRPGILIGNLLGYFIAALIFALPGYFLKSKKSKIAAYALLLITGFCELSGLYMVVAGTSDHDSAMLWGGALMALFWMCLARVSWRAICAIKFLKSTEAAA